MAGEQYKITDFEEDRGNPVVTVIEVKSTNLEGHPTQVPYYFGKVLSYLITEAGLNMKSERLI